MPSYSAGTADIRIRPNTENWVRDLRAKLKATPDPGFVVSVQADTGQAKADIERFRELQQRNGVKLGVDADTKGFRESTERAKQQASKPVRTQLELDVDAAENKLRALRIQERARNLKIDVEVDADPAKAELQLRALRAREEARKIELRVDVDRSAIGRLGELSSQLGRMGGSGGALKLNVGLAGIAALPTAAAGLAQVAAAMQQVAQAGIVVPGAIAAAAASVGTLTLGLSGIKDAYKAVSDASESAGTDQAASARAAAQASNQLRNAVVDEAQAQRDVARATADRRRELRDLALEQRGGMIDESRAILEAQKAREDLARGNYSDQRDAALRVAEADQRVLEVRARNADTASKLNEETAKGVTGSDQVVAANERLTRSQQQVADAQAAVADTAGKSSTAQSKADELMGKLAPNARAMVSALIGLKPAFADLRAAASEPMLDGIDREFTDFVHDLLPSVKGGITEIARGWNQNFRALMGSIGSSDGKGLLDRILGNTGDAQKRVSAAMDPLVKGIGTLAAAGSDALPRLADGFTAVMDRFRNFITDADQDGRLQQWIDDGITGLRQVGETVLNIGKSFSAITTAAGGGGTFLQWLQDASGRLQTFLNSAEGQNKLKQFFADGKAMFDQWRPILEDLPGLMKGVYDGATTYIGGLLKIIQPITDALSNHPTLIQHVVEAFAAWKMIDGVTSLIGDLGRINDALGSGGRNGKGGKGILGKLALMTVAGVALDSLLTDDPAGAGGPQAKPDTPPAPGGVPSGDLPAGQPLPFSGAPVIPPGAANDIGRGAAAGAVATGGNPIAAGLGALVAAPSAGEDPRSKAEKDAEVLLFSIPRMPDSELKNIADPLGLTVDQIKAMSRDDLRKRLLAALTGPAPAPPPPPTDPTGGLLTPGFIKGGPTPSGRGPGPTGGFLSELHGDEWVLPKHARRALGDKLLWQLTEGRSFLPGGYIDQYGNPVTPGNAPGPVAPPPATTGPLPSPAISALSSIIPGLSLPNTAAPADPAAAGPQQSANWLMNDWLGGTIVGGLMTSVLPKVLGAVGLEGILSSPYLSAIGKTVSHFSNLATPAPQAAGAAPGNVDVNSLIALAAQNGYTLTPSTIGSLRTGSDQTSSGAAPQPDWEAIAQGESGGNWQIPSDSSGGPYRGGLQILDSTWQQFGGTAYAPTADKATKEQQIAVAEKILAAQGPGAWPNTFTTKAAAAGAGLSGAAAKPGESARDFAHRAMMPYWQSQGYTVGDHGADKYGEHQNGAIDIMVPSIEAGTRVLQQVLSDPNVYGAIFNNQTYGYGHGSTPRDYSAGHTGNPTQDHQDHVHVWYKPTSAKQYREGGPTEGPAHRAIPALLHGDEYVISARGRATVPDSFLHALNTGQIDGAALPQFAEGGDVARLIRAAAVTPRPPSPRGPAARQMQPRAAAPQPRPAPATTTPAAPQTAPPAPPTPAVPPPPAEQATPAPAQSPVTAPLPVAAPRGTDYSVPWVNTAIQSTAATAGNLAAAAATMGAGGLGGAAGGLIQGAFGQIGKIGQDVANVVSASMVGSVPGSFMTTPEAYGRTQTSQPRELATAADRYGSTRVQNNTFHGMDVPQVFRELDLRDSISQQSQLANHPDRI